MLKLRVFKRIFIFTILAKVSLVLTEPDENPAASEAISVASNPRPKARGLGLGRPLPSIRGNSLKTIKGADVGWAAEEIKSLVPYSPIYIDTTDGNPETMKKYINAIEHTTDILLNSKIVVLQPDTISFYLNAKSTGTIDPTGSPYHFLFPRYAFSTDVEKDEAMNLLMRKLNGDDVDAEKFAKVEHLGMIIDHERYITYRDSFMKLLYFEIEGVSDVAKVITQATKENELLTSEDGSSKEEEALVDMADALTVDSDQNPVQDGALVSLEAGIYFTANELYDIKDSVISIVVSDKSTLKVRMDSIKLISEFSGPYDYIKFIIQSSQTLKSYSIEFKDDNIVTQASNNIIRLTIRAGDHAKSILVNDPPPNDVMSESSAKLGLPLDDKKSVIFYRFANDASSDSIELGESRSFKSVLNAKDRTLIITPSNSAEGEDLVITFPPSVLDKSITERDVPDEGDRLMHYNIDYFELFYMLISLNLLAGTIENQDL